MIYAVRVHGLDTISGCDYYERTVVLHGRTVAEVRRGAQHECSTYEWVVGTPEPLSNDDEDDGN